MLIAIRTSTGATPYSLMYGMEAALPAEIEIPSLLMLIEAQLEETKRIKQRYEQLSSVKTRKGAKVMILELSIKSRMEN